MLSLFDKFERRKRKLQKSVSGLTRVKTSFRNEKAKMT